MARPVNKRIEACLRRYLWLPSPERSAIKKIQNSTCQRCGVIESKSKDHPQKMQVHHKEGVNNWDEIYAAIKKNLLVEPDKLECLCPKCHKEETYKEK